MYNSETEVLFPLRFAEELVDLRDDEWKKLVKFIISDQASRTDRVAFILFMVRLNGCVGCNADSYRAMRGCITCARLAIKRYKSGDDDLIHVFEQAKNEIVSFYAKKNFD